MEKGILLGIGIVITIIILVIIVINNFNIFREPNVIKEPTTINEVTNNKLTEQSSNEIVEEDGCPPEINRSYFFGLLNTASLSNYNELKADEEWFLNNKGSIDGYFVKNDSVGHSKDYRYSNPNMTYQRTERLDEQGLLIKEKWNINIVYNHTSCESLGYWEIPNDVNTYQAFKCNLVSVNCIQLG